MRQRSSGTSSRRCLVALLALGTLLAPVAASAQLGRLLGGIFGEEEASEAPGGAGAAQGGEGGEAAAEAAPPLEPGVCPDLVTPEMASEAWPEACGADRPPEFADPSVDPMIHLEGLWSVQLVDCPVISEALTYIGKGRQGLGPREAGAGWSHSPLARWTQEGNVTGIGDREVKIGPDGSVSLGFASYGFSGRWLGGSARPVSGSDVLVGEWSWSGETGPMVLRRRPPARIEQVEFHWNVKDEAGNAIVDRVAYGERPGRIEREHQLTCGAGRMRGNCPTFFIVVRGTGFAGAHSVWIDPATKLEPEPMWLCRNGHRGRFRAGWVECGADPGLGDAVGGLWIRFYVWDGVRPGPKTLWIDDQPVPFELMIRGFPEEEPQEPQLRELRALGSDGEPVDELAEGLVFRVEARFDAPHPDSWIALGMPEPDDSSAFDVLYSAARRVVGGEEPAAEAEAPPPGPSVTLWREQDPAVFRSRWLRVEAIEEETQTAGEVAP